jgi:Protein of unknown function (DUF1761)
MPNFLMALVAGIIPLLVGMLWYSEKAFGNAWMREAGVDTNAPNERNMVISFGLTYLCGVFIAAALFPIVIHQMGIFSTLAGDPGVGDPNTPIGAVFANLMAQYGQNFRTFKHGMLHGALSGVLFATPVVAISALFERKSFKYIGIHAGYWIVTLALMGGVISAFA